MAVVVPRCERVAGSPRSHAFCGDVDLAEEAVQEALARAWERTERGEVIDDLMGWAVVVSFNGVRSTIRRRRREARARGRLMRLDPPEEPSIAAEQLAVRAAVAALPARQREVTVLHYYLRLPVAEIATLLGISPGAVKNALHNARQALGRNFGAGASDERTTEDLDATP